MYHQKTSPQSLLRVHDNRVVSGGEKNEGENDSPVLIVASLSGVFTAHRVKLDEECFIGVVVAPRDVSLMKYLKAKL